MRSAISLLLLLWVSILGMPAQSLESVPDSLTLDIQSKMRERNYQEAWSSYKILQSHYDENELSIDTTFAKASLFVAQSYIFTNKNQLSKAHYTIAKEILIEAQNIDPIYLMQCYLGLGIIHKRFSKLDSAIVNYEYAKKLAIDNFGSRDKSLHNIYNNLGNVHRILGNFEEAIYNHEQALEIRKIFYPNSFRVGDSYNNIGLIYTDLLQFSKAKLNLLQAIDYYQSDQAHVKLRSAKAHYNIARIYYDLHVLEESLKYVDPAILLVEELNQKEDFFYAEMLNLKTNVLIGLERLEEAESLLDETIELKSNYLDEDHLHWNFTHTTASLMAQKRQDYIAQKDHLLQSLVISQKHYRPNHPEILEIYHSLVRNALIKGDLTAAESYLDTIDRRINHGQLSHAGLYDKHKIKWKFSTSGFFYKQFQETGNMEFLDLALEYSRDAIQQHFSLKQYNLEEKSQALLTSQSRNLIDLWVELCYVAYAKTGDVLHANNALIAIDKNKAALLKEISYDHGNISSHLLPSEVRDKERLLKNSINKIREAFYSEDEDLEFTVEEFNEEAESLKLLYNEISKNHPKFFDYFYTYEDLDINQLAQLSQIDSILFLSYHVVNNDLYIHKISSSGVDFIKRDIPSENELLAIRKQISANIFSQEMIDQCEQLYTRLVEGIITDSERKKRLIIVPNQHLNTLPFELLIKSGDKSSFLIEDHAISYAYSLSNWLNQKMEENSTKNNSILGFAPNYKMDFLSQEKDSVLSPSIVALRDESQRLPGALETVMSLKEENPGKYFLGKVATKQNFINNIQKHDILHFSMHGIHDVFEPLSSGLVFQPQSSDDNFLLTAREIYALDIEAEMAVLSACNTGWGDHSSQEGINSLGYAFSYAGVNSNVMSLWKVPDEATSKIMTSFYHHLKNGLDKTQALQNAKIDYLNNCVDPVQRNPFYWAGFILNGDISPLNSSSSYPYLAYVFGFLISGYFGLFHKTRQ